jgi:hypothetical protein
MLDAADVISQAGALGAAETRQPVAAPPIQAPRARILQPYGTRRAPKWSSHGW